MRHLESKDRPLLHLALLVATFASTFLTFFLPAWLAQAPGTGNFNVPEHVWSAATFSLSLILILGCHEMGHYVMARYHGVDASLPYFIPLPLIGFGTLGAVIRLRGRIPDRNALVDIGAWGPLAGMLMTLPILAIGISHSSFTELPPMAQPTLPGEASLWVLLPKAFRTIHAWLTGATPPESPPLTRLFYGDNLLILFMTWWVKGQLPPPGQTLSMHPVAMAGWFGTLMTMLNLMPVGQLDGGHVAYALWGERAKSVGLIAVLSMLGFSFLYSATWLVWVMVVTFFVGLNHPPVVNRTPPLSLKRRWICTTCWVVLALCLLPVPVQPIP